MFVQAYLISNIKIINASWSMLTTRKNTYSLYVFIVIHVISKRQ